MYQLRFIVLIFYDYPFTCFTCANMEQFDNISSRVHTFNYLLKYNNTNWQNKKQCYWTLWLFATGYVPSLSGTSKSFRTQKCTHVGTGFAQHYMAENDIEFIRFASFKYYITPQPVKLQVCSWRYNAKLSEWKRWYQWATILYTTFSNVCCQTR